MKYAQYNKEDGQILNLIEVSNGYIFNGNYGFAKADNYPLTIGDFFIDGEFYDVDKTTIIQKIPTAEQLLEQQLSEANKQILLLESQKTALTDRQDFIEDCMEEMAIKIYE